MKKERHKGMTRREFIWRVGGLTITFILTPLSCKKEQPPSPFKRGCMEATTHEQQTMEALAETIIPGRATDPEGSPGAVEACTLNLIYDERLPMSEATSFISLYLDTLSKNNYGKNFRELDLEERCEIVQEAEDAIPLLTLALKYIRIAFYGGEVNKVGLEYLGYPGPNLGYIDQDFSFCEKLSPEITTDGNLP